MEKIEISDEVLWGTRTSLRELRLQRMGRAFTSWSMGCGFKSNRVLGFLRYTTSFLAIVKNRIVLKASIMFSLCLTAYQHTARFLKEGASVSFSSVCGSFSLNQKNNLCLVRRPIIVMMTTHIVTSSNHFYLVTFMFSVQPLENWLQLFSRLELWL